VGEGIQFAICTDVEQTARGIVGARGEGVAIGEEAADEKRLSDKKEGETM
jgi:hypothetical protein